MAKAEYKSAIRSKRLISEALADLLMEKSMEKITVTDIVKRADINRGTFYAHYADVPDLVDHLIRQTFDSLREAMTQEPETVAQMGHALLIQIQKILETDLPFYQKVLSSSASALMQDRLVEITMDYFLQNTSSFYPKKPEEFALAVRFCAGGLSNLYRDWFSGKLPCTLTELTQIGEALIRRVIGDL